MVSVDGDLDLDYFQLLAIIMNAAVNKGMQAY